MNREIDYRTSHFKQEFLPNAPKDITNASSRAVIPRATTRYSRRGNGDYDYLSRACPNAVTPLPSTYTKMTKFSLWPVQIPPKHMNIIDPRQKYHSLGEQITNRQPPPIPQIRPPAITVQHQQRRRSLMVQVVLRPQRRRRQRQRGHPLRIAVLGAQRR